MPKNRKNQKKDTSLDSWVTQLAKGCAETTTATTTTKQERIQKRAAKKRRREERQSMRGSVREDPPRAEEVKERKRQHLLASVREEMEASVASYLQEHGSRRGRLYQPPKPKAKNRKKNWAEVNIQPRNRDYGGIGLARPSMFLELDDPSFFPKLEVEFAEHIPGFFGKQRTKAMKKQQSGKMLWRQLADKKNSNKKLNGKKLADMNPDERVEAMLRAGMI